MIHDEDLKSSQDYNEGQKAAAHRVLVELVNLFHEYRDDIRIVGGWVPDLMFPDEGHVGSVDVDVLINHIKLKDSGYSTMSKILLRNGYEEHPDKYFSFIKRVQIDGIDYDVDVDILAGMYGGTQKKKRSQHVQGIKALKASGGNFAFEFDPQTIRVEAERTDGALDVARVSVIAVVPYFVMKTAAMGRGKAKDAYDLYFLVKHYHDGLDGLAKLFEDYKESRIILEMKQKLSEKFASPNHAGPTDVAAFLDLVDEEEIAFTKRDAYERMQALIRRLE
ncbi:MAG: hypothetical protein IKQ96_05995 [Lachnospiraceae bacterium]|nr:hypothetical protein [Lachnospiraceae bacterium]